MEGIMEHVLCSCQKAITHAVAKSYFDASFSGGALNSDLEGWRYGLSGHCGNGCCPVDMGTIKFLFEIKDRFPDIVNVDVLEP